MFVYRGMELEHWREEFQGDNCAQVFYTITTKSLKTLDKNINDGRLCI